MIVPGLLPRVPSAQPVRASDGSHDRDFDRALDRAETRRHVGNVQDRASRDGNEDATACRPFVLTGENLSAPVDLEQWPGGLVAWQLPATLGSAYTAPTPTAVANEVCRWVLLTRKLRDPRGDGPLKVALPCLPGTTVRLWRVESGWTIRAETGDAAAAGCLRAAEHALQWQFHRAGLGVARLSVSVVGEALASD